VPRVVVLYFAQARDAAGTAREFMKLEEPATVNSLLSTASRYHPRLSKVRRGMRVAVNTELCPETLALHEGDEVALLPPVIGG